MHLGFLLASRHCKQKATSYFLVLKSILCSPYIVAKHSMPAQDYGLPIRVITRIVRQETARTAVRYKLVNELYSTDLSANHIQANLGLSSANACGCYIL